MKKILIITNTSVYNYHNSISQLISEKMSFHATVITIDISSFRYANQCFSTIENFAPSVLITLDLAGFHIRTQSNECALNTLHCKCLNLLWGNKPEYAVYLHGKLSLSMIFYDVSGKNNNLPLFFPNMLYYKSSFQLSPKYPHNIALDTWDNLWKDFTSEVLLS